MSTKDQIARDEFREYLARTGVIKHLTGILIEIYEKPERPENPLDYIRRYLGTPMDVDVDALKAQNEELRLKKEELEATIDSLMNQLEDLRKEEDDI